MKTTTSRTSGSNGNTVTSNRQREGAPAIITTPMQQVIRWVKIELQVRADLADALTSRPEIVRQNYGRDLYGPCIDLRDALDRSDTDGQTIRAALHLAEAFGDLDGYESKAFVVTMREDWWRRIEAIAEALAIPLEELVRGLLFKRWLGLQKADRRPPAGSVAEMRENLRECLESVPRITSPPRKAKGADL